MIGDLGLIDSVLTPADLNNGNRSKGITLELNDGVICGIEASRSIINSYIVIEVANVIIEVANVIIGVANVVIGVANVVIEIGNVVIGVANVVIEIGNVVIEIGNLIIEIGNLIIGVAIVVIGVQNLGIRIQIQCPTRLKLRQSLLVHFVMGTDR